MGWNGMEHINHQKEIISNLFIHSFFFVFTVTELQLVIYCLHLHSFLPYFPLVLPPMYQFNQSCASFFHSKSESMIERGKGYSAHAHTFLFRSSNWIFSVCHSIHFSIFSLALSVSVFDFSPPCDSHCPTIHLFLKTIS